MGRGRQNSDVIGGNGNDNDRNMIIEPTGVVSVSSYLVSSRGNFLLNSIMKVLTAG